MLEERGRDRLVLGALSMIGAAFMFSLAGVAIKIAATSVPNEALVFWRNAISLTILAPWALRHRRHWLGRHNMPLITARALAVLAALYCYYYAVAVIPLADAVLLNFSSPIFVPLLGLMMFGFAIERSVMAAVLIGFFGVALVLQPGAGVLEPGALAGLLAGLLGGFAIVVLWRMPSSEHPARVAFFFALIGTVLSSGPMVASGAWPGSGAWAPLVLLGVCSTAAHLLLAYGCLVAPADRVATLDYTAILFAGVMGWLIWGERPDGFLILGGVLIVGAGIFVVRSRPKRPPPAQPLRLAPARALGSECSTP